MEDARAQGVEIDWGGDHPRAVAPIDRARYVRGLSTRNRKPQGRDDSAKRVPAVAWRIVGWVSKYDAGGRSARPTAGAVNGRGGDQSGDYTVDVRATEAGDYIVAPMCPITVVSDGDGMEVTSGKAVKIGQSLRRSIKRTKTAAALP